MEVKLQDLLLHTQNEYKNAFAIPGSGLMNSEGVLKKKKWKNEKSEKGKV